MSCAADCSCECHQKELQGPRPRMLKLLYDVTTSRANDGTIGAHVDTVYLGMNDFSFHETRAMLEKLRGQGLVKKFMRKGDIEHQYRLTPKGVRYVEKKLPAARN